MPEHLLGEERIALCLGVHGVDERCRRLLSAQRAQQRGHTLLREPLQGHLAGQAATPQIFQRPGQTVVGCNLRVAVGPDGQHRQVRNVLGQMLQKEQGSFVSPVEVFEHEEQRPLRCRPGEDVTEAVEQEVTFLLRGQLQRRGDVGEEPPEQGEQLGHLGGVVAEEGSERPGAGSGGQRLLEDLDEGHVRWRSFDLVAATHEDLRALAGGVGCGFFREPGLPHTRFAADEHQAPIALARLVKPAGELGPFVLATDVRRPRREHRATGRLASGSRRCDQRRRGNRIAPLEVRRLLEDRRLERGQGGAGFEADFFGEELAQVPVGPEGLDLAAGAVESEYPLAPQPFPEWMGPGQGVEFGDELGVAPAGQVGVDPLLGGRQPGFLQAGRFGPGDGPVGHVGQRRAPPQGQRFAQRAGRLIRRTAARLLPCRLYERLEAGCVQAVGRHLGEVAGGLGDNYPVPAPLAQRLAQP